MAGTLLALAAILQLLDLLDQASSIVTHGGLAAVGRYVALRLPALLAETMPIATLAGALLTFVRLAGGLEMTAIRAAGLSLPSVLGGLLPACLLLAVIQLALQGEIAPRSERGLSNWWVQTTPPGNVPAQSRLWLRTHGEIAAIDRVSPDGHTLGNVLIVQRAANGDLTARLDARSAHFAQQRWLLHDVQVDRAGQAKAQTRPELEWRLGPAPANLVELAWPVGSQTLERLIATLRGDWAGQRGPLFYWTTFDGLLVSLVDPVLMLLLAAPLLLTPPRSGRNGLETLKVIGLGLGYLGVAGLLAAMGDVGTLPPALAAVAPMLVFGGYGIARLLQAETS